jgi:hypothetical protein
MYMNIDSPAAITYASPIVASLTFQLVIYGGSIDAA